MSPPRHNPISLQSLLLIPAIQTSILSSLPSVSGYIPALPVNDTSSLNLTDSSSISISWTDPPSVYSGSVSYQLKADVPTGGTTQGALVHFSESTMGPNITTTTPWIAYVSCDRNESEASQEWDIFTLARDRGARSALLYTATSESCLLNEDYIQNFEKPLDVFATKTVQVARVIDNQWSHTNKSFYWFNNTLLNISGTDVNNSLLGNPPDYRTFLIGTLAARNSTGQAEPTGIPNQNPSSSPSSGHSTPASMIALYVITGIISAVFVLMLALGTRRALRHPERYGRRDATDDQESQTAAGGLAQAILDTFPIIKFNRTGNSPGYNNARAKRVSSDASTRLTSLAYSNDAAMGAADVDGKGTGSALRERSDRDRGDTRSIRDSIALRSLRSDDTESFHSALDGPSGRGSFIGDDDGSIRTGGGKRTSAPRSLMSAEGSRRASRLDLQHHALLEEMGSEEVHGEGKAREARIDGGNGEFEDQCPICLLDFEEGDDLRVLPCEKEHVYHQACIDPWLLQVSGSCPLCRKDFNNPNPHPPPSPVPEEGHSSPSASNAPSITAPTQSGFAKYLAFMRRERRARSGRPGSSSRRSRANTANSAAEAGVGPGRRREADQTGPGGY